MTLIPAELQALPCWVLWKYGRPDKTGKLTKLPYDPKNGRMAKANDPATWGTFDQATKSLQKYRYNGIGFEISEDDPYCGIDLDHCIDPTTKELLPWARKIIEKMRTYTERTPSGTGLHLILKGRLSGEHNRKGHIEMYDKRRYFTMTGQVLEGHATIEERQAELDELFWETFKNEPANVLPMQPNRGPSQAPPSDIIERAKRAHNGDKFSKLWAGDTSSYSSQSEADQALCNMLAFWCCKEPAQIDAFFRQSGLYREKWERQDYRERTIVRAVDQCREVFNPSSGERSTAGGSLRPVIAQWDPPVPLQEFDLPPFPVDIFPTWLRDYAEALSTATQTPKDLAGMLILAVCATALAKKFEIKLRDGWQEPVNLFTVVALPPGERKSAVFAEVIKPLEEYEAGEAERLSPEIADAKSKQKILEERLRSAQAKAAKTDAETAREAELEASLIAREIDDLSIPTSPRYVADDVSPEKAASLLAEQGGRLAILSPEGGIFDILAGRYSQNSCGNFEVFLKGHAGDTLRVDRVGRPPEHVKKPALTVGLAVQPDVLRGLVEKPGFRGRGLLARFHYAVPQSLVGGRITNPAPVPQYIRSAFNLGIVGIVGAQPRIDEDGKPVPHILSLSPEAEALSNEFAAWLEPQMAMFGDLGCIADWAAKLHGGIARVAAIIHVAANINLPMGWDNPVSKETFEAAIRYGKYLIPHAKATFAEMGSDGKLANAVYVLKWIEKQEQSELKKQDIWQGTKSRFQKVEPLDDALQILVDYNYIRVKEEPEHEGKGRRKAPTYEVNPLSYKSYKSYKSSNDTQNSNSSICSTSRSAEPEAEDSNLLEVRI